MKRHRNLYKILCVGLAIFLWIYVFVEVNPTTKHTVSGLDVVLENQKILENRGLAVKNVEPESVAVKLEGKRGQFYYLKPNVDLAAVVDSGKLHIGTNTVPVKVLVPDGYKVAEKYPGHIKIKVEKKLTAWKDIVVKKYGDIPENKELGNIRMSARKIKVSAPAGDIDKVHAVEVKLNADDIKKSRQNVVQLTPIAVDKLGKEIKNAKVMADNIRVHAEIYDVKRVPLKVMISRYGGSEKEIVQFDAPKHIYIKGDRKILDQIKEIGTSEILISDASQEGKVTVKPILLPGVELSDKNLKISVAYKLKQN